MDILKQIIHEGTNNPTNYKYIAYDQRGPLLVSLNTGQPYSSKTIRETIARIPNIPNLYFGGQTVTHLSIYELMENIIIIPLSDNITNKGDRCLYRMISTINKSDRLIRPKPKITLKFTKQKLKITLKNDVEKSLSDTSEIPSHKLLSKTDKLIDNVKHCDIIINEAHQMAKILENAVGQLSVFKNKVITLEHELNTSKEIINTKEKKHKQAIKFLEEKHQDKIIMLEKKCDSVEKGMSSMTQLLVVKSNEVNEYKSKIKLNKYLTPEEIKNTTPSIDEKFGSLVILQNKTNMDKDNYTIGMTYELNPIDMMNKIGKGKPDEYKIITFNIIKSTQSTYDNLIKIFSSINKFGKPHIDKKTKAYTFSGNPKEMSDILSAYISYHDLLINMI